MKVALSICVLFYSRHEKTAEFQRFSAGDERIELPLRVLETPVIPFDQSPSLVFLTVFTYITFWTVMSSILYSIEKENRCQIVKVWHMSNKR